MHKQNKLIHGKPIIYTRQEIEARFMKSIPIYLDSEILEEVKKFLQIYEMVSFYIIYIYMKLLNYKYNYKNIKILNY